MKEQIKMVEDFHKKLGYPWRKTPSPIPQEEAITRHRLMKEEVTEYGWESTEENLLKIADACGDILYTVFGTIVAHGLQDIMTDIFAEIHRSNMTKVNSGVGKADKSKEEFSPADLSRWFKGDNPHE